jgi:DNA modification methylase
VLKPGGSLLTLAGVAYLPQILEMMSKHINYQWTISYHMPAKSVQVWYRKVRCNWKPILWFVKGKYEGNWLKDVLVAGPREKELHPWQQTEADFAELVEMSTQPGETIIDPFFGSGTLGMAAMKLNRKFVGIEIEQSTSQTAEVRLEREAKKIVLLSHYSDDNSDTQKTAIST